MQFTTSFLISALALAASAKETDADLHEIDIPQFLSSLAITPTATISPAQSTAVVNIADSYAYSFLSRSDILALGSQIVNALGSKLSTSLGEEALHSVLDEAEDSFYTQPASFLGTVNAQITGLPQEKKAKDVQADFYKGLQSVIGKELKVTPGAKPGPKPTGLATTAAPANKAQATPAPGVKKGGASSNGVNAMMAGVVAVAGIAVLL